MDSGIEIITRKDFLKTCHLFGFHTMIDGFSDDSCFHVLTDLVRILQGGSGKLFLAQAFINQQAP